ncbi:MAG TPA: S8 family serine peptidase [Candidatus Sulfomarinibacteraceae bacterium]|nr:S8 family serine peptidase [Candidatus Sulfomarinibacteraceae bacterium]
MPSANRRPYKLLLLILAFVCLLGSGAASRSSVRGAQGPAVDPQVRQALQTAGVARVNILLHALEEPVLHEALIARQQQAVLATAPSGSFQLIRRYQTIPALTGLLSAEGLAALEKEPAIQAVQLDAGGRGHLAQSVSALQADEVWQELGLSGAGVRVAVLDTGIDASHPDLAGAIVAQHCFTDGDCAPHGDDESNIAQDEHGHGTNVAGVLASAGLVSSRGFAPGVELVALRVLNSSNWGWLSDWVAALDWIVANQQTLQVDVVNMSLGTLALYEGNCDNVWPTMAQVLDRLAALDVIVFASSGNQGALNAMGSPACNSNVVAVGATYDSNLGRQPFSGTYRSVFGGNWPDCNDAATSLNVITCFTNSGPMLDIVAPGARITAPGMGGGLSTYVGTSQASPTAAGIAALMLEANNALTPAQIETMLKNSGALLTDTRNGLRFPSINARRAVSATLTAPQRVTVQAPPVVLPGLTYGFSATVEPTAVTHPLTYTWQATGHAPLSHVRSEATDNATFSWPALGPQTVFVTVSNDLGQVQNEVTFEVIPGFSIVLPHVDAPPAPQPLP